MTKKELIAELNELIECITTESDYEEVTHYIISASFRGYITDNRMMTMMYDAYLMLPEDVKERKEAERKQKADNYWARFRKNA